MANTLKPKDPKTIDVAKIDSMIEPISVNVDKMKGSARQNIPLPGGIDDTGQPLSPGTGWDKDNVKNIGTWLCSEWSGGGYYEITATDSSEPPTVHKWTTFYEPTRYPERVPPPLQGGTLGAQQAQQAPQLSIVPPAPPPRSYPVSSFPNGLPPGQPYPFPQAQPAPYQAQSGYYPAPSYSMPIPPAPSGYDPRFAAVESQLREAQAALTRERETAIQARHQQELAAVQERARSESSRLEAKIAELTQLVTQVVQGGGPNAHRAPDPQLEMMREQNRIQAEENRRLMERQDREARERQLQDSIKAQNDQIMLQVRTMEANFTRIIEAMKEQGRGHDPLIAMFQEQQRTQMEALKDVARAGRESLSELKGFMMSPRDVIGLVKDSSQGVDTVATQVTKAFTNVIDVQGRLMEQMTSLNQSGDSPTTLIRDGIERAGTMFERWVSGKSKEAIATQQTQASMAQSQAQAMTAQAMHAQAQAAQLSGVMPAGAPPLPPPPSARPVPVPVPVVPSLSTVAASGGPTMGMGSGGNGGQITITNGLNGHTHVVPTVPLRLGKTDEQWFTPQLLPEIKRLREGVARAIESVSVTPNRVDKATGKLDGITPEQAADYIAKAIGIVMSQKMVVPALNDLLFQQRLADFVDVLLPDAPVGYKNETIQAIHAKLSSDAEDELDDDDDDDDDDDGEEDADDDGDDRQLAERSTRATTPIRPTRPSA